MNFNRNLKILRQNKGYTQEQLAELIGLSKFAIRRYEQNQAEPSFSILEKIKIALECSYDDLLS